MGLFQGLRQVGNKVFAAFGSQTRLAEVYGPVILQLDNDFTAGDIIVARVGPMVSIARYSNSPAHASLNTVTSSDGLLPKWAWPTVLAHTNVAYVNDNVWHRVQVSSTGQYILQYWNNTGNQALTAGANQTITYPVND